ncbi:hypothetical protein B0H15DRAFT_1027530 [Mycena belliarum]|uniref:Uncharacterized protein n=1 Tax=Mycena belliarum TaxID=1033014 RepID=A0AAD6TMP0_9AGAR|nr:hypothetical protein B0H15DRAFT_1027530 [Mycena belliae]
MPPLPYPGADDNFYLIAMFNRRDADHLRVARVRNVVDDPLIEAARVSMGVDQDKSLESPLQWFRWPLHWLHAEQKERYAREMAEMLAKTQPSQAAVQT